MDKEDVTHAHTYTDTMGYYLAIKMMKYCHLQNIGESRRHYAKSDKKGQKYIISFM